MAPIQTAGLPRPSRVQTIPQVDAAKIAKPTNTVTPDDRTVIRNDAVSQVTQLFRMGLVEWIVDLSPCVFGTPPETYGFSRTC